MATSSSAKPMDNIKNNVKDAVAQRKATGGMAPVTQVAAPAPQSYSLPMAVNQTTMLPVKDAMPVPQSYTVAAKPTGPDTNPYVAPQSLTELNNKASSNLLAAGNNIYDQITGKAYDPYALQTQQALGRAEANQRAKTASAIHSSGFSGTPLGASAGNAVESDLLRNRFDTNLGIEVERQNMKNTGIGNAMKYGDAVSQLQNDDLTRAKSVFDLDRTKWDWEDGKIDTQMKREAGQFALDTAKANEERTAYAQAQNDVAAALQSNIKLQDIISSGSANAALLEIGSLLQSNPKLRADFARVLGREPTAEDVYDYTKNMMLATSDTETAARSLAGFGGDVDAWKAAIQAFRAGQLEVALDKDGDLQLKATDNDNVSSGGNGGGPTEPDMNTAIGSDYMWNGYNWVPDPKASS